MCFFRKYRPPGLEQILRNTKKTITAIVPFTSGLGERERVDVRV